MKKIAMACLLLALAATSVEARDISQGRIMVTGDTNIDISSSETSYSGGSTTTDSTEINLASVYFVSPNIGVGLLLGHEKKETDNGSSVSEQSTTMIGPIVGFNVSLNQDVSLMFHGAIFTVDGELEEGAVNADIDGDGYLVGASVNYFFNDYVATSFSLRRVESDVDFSVGGNTFDGDLEETGASVGLSVFF